MESDRRSPDGADGVACKHPEQIGQWVCPICSRRTGRIWHRSIFDEIVRLPLVRQATEAAAAGVHSNILYIGPAGTGK